MKGKKRKRIPDQRPPCHFIIYGKHVVNFEFLKRFIEIPFIKTEWSLGFSFIHPVQLLLSALSIKVITQSCVPLCLSEQ